MADVKINKRTICGDSSFRVTSGDVEKEASQYLALIHDETEAKSEIGFGSKITNHVDPMVLSDDEYFDLPSESYGVGFILVGDVDQYARFVWDSVGRVTLIESTTLVDDSLTDGYFCIHDTGDTARITNKLGYSVRILFEYSVFEYTAPPVFQALNVKSGVDQLDPYLTINGTTVAPMFRYKGGDADGTDWDYWGFGEDLDYQSGTTPTYNDGSSGLGTNDDSVKFNSGAYYKADNNSFADITTEDLVFELVFKATNTSLLRILSKHAANGYMIRFNAGVLQCYLDDGDIVAANSAALTSGNWYHAICFVNRDEASTSGCRWYVNGILSGTGTDVSSASSTLTEASPLCIGAATTGANPYDENVAYAAAWKQADWHQAGSNAPVEWAVIAKERFLKFTGIFPQIAASPDDVIADGDMETAGIASWTAADATLSKDTTAPLYEGTQHLRITSTGATFYAGQSILVAGGVYRVTGACRSVSGSAVCRISDGVGIGIWYGTSSTDWQEFDFTFVNTANTNIYFGSASSSGVVDFDDITVELLHYFPTVHDRAFDAYLDKMEGSVRKLYYVGDEWLRMAHRQDSAGVNVRGYLSETQNENLALYSEAFSNWTKQDAGDTVTDNVAVCPDGRTVASKIVMDTDSGFHGITQATTLTAATYTYSIFAKPGDFSWFRMSSNVAGCTVYFDIGNGVVGTAASCSGYIEGPFYSGDSTPFYRCAMVFTGTAASHNLNIWLADSDGDVTVQGDGSDNMYFWGAQIEQSDYMTSPIKTTSSTLTRLKDQLRFVAGNNIGGEDVGSGELVADVLFPNFDSLDYKGVVALSDDLTSADRVCLLADNSGGYSRLLTAASGGNAGSSVDTTTDLTDGIKHELSGDWADDSVVVYTDGVADTSPDTSADMPNDLNYLEIGSLQNSALQTNGLIQNVRAYEVGFR